jgi:hypothetical protein
MVFGITLMEMEEEEEPAGKMLLEEEEVAMLLLELVEQIKAATWVVLVGKL